MQHRIVVTGVIFKGDAVLLGKKAPGKGPYPDTWHLPGGGVDFGVETCEQAFQREVKEEAGIAVENIQEAFWDTDVELNKHGEQTYYIFLQYTCNYASGSLTPGDDMHHFEWVLLEQVKEYNLNKPTKALFERLGYL